VNELASEPPAVNSLLIAERVFRDAKTGQWVIAGVFNQMSVPALPFSADRFDVFFQITNVGRGVDLQLRIEHADSGDVVTSIGGAMTAPDPLRVVEQHVIFRNAPFARRGKYWVQLLSEEEILTQAPLHIAVTEETPDGDET
jgi:hypothetical protein